MGVKVRTVLNKFPRMQAAVEGLCGARVRVGAKGESAWLAGIHEYGCHIPVTEKMRAYLHSQGLHLRKSTKVIVIPERSFLRTGFDLGEEQILNAVDKTVGRVLGGEMDEGAMLRMVGLLLKSSVQDQARDLRDPPLHPFTVKRKGSSNPLVSTGDMIEHIGYEVVKE